jgi:hypothetical protein
LAWSLTLLAIAGPAGAANDHVVLVGCDLLTEPGPTALYRQDGGASSNGTGISIGIGGRNGLAEDDVRGRSCAQVLAEVAAEGRNFRDFRIVGPNATQGIWFWKSR